MRRLFPAAVLLVGIACFVPGFATVARGDDAADRAAIDGDVDQALAQLYKTVPGSREVEKRAKGVLVFPAIYKGGIGIGGQYGKGALRVNGKSVGYYNTAGASIGLQLGGEKHSMVLMFQTKDALQRFENSSGWDVGGDASVTLVDVGASGQVDASTLNKPVVAFVYGNTGLMAGVSLKGTKISKLDLPPASLSGSSAPK